MNYTKGPWTLNNFVGELFIPEIHIAFLRSHSTDLKEDREIRASEQGQIELANARLIAAAPDMYEALKAYIEHVERFHGEGGYPGNRCEWCLDREKEMRQALAKAEGRQIND